MPVLGVCQKGDSPVSDSCQSSLLLFVDVVVILFIFFTPGVPREKGKPEEEPEEERETEVGVDTASISP